MAGHSQIVDQDLLPQDLKKRIQQSYDAISQTYTQWTVQEHTPVKLEFLDKLLHLIAKSNTDATNPPLAILELGAGAATPVTEHVLTTLPSAQITANDISSVQIAAGKVNLQRLGFDPGRVDWREGDMMSLSFPAGSFDAAVALYSVIHLPVAEQRVILSRIFDWLRSGGYFLANFSDRPLALVMEKWLDHDKGWMFWHGLGAAQTLEAMREVGFEIVLEERRQEDEHATFLWVIARKP